MVRTFCGAETVLALSACVGAPLMICGGGEMMICGGGDLTICGGDLTICGGEMPLLPDAVIRGRPSDSAM